MAQRLLRFPAEEVFVGSSPALRFYDFTMKEVSLIYQSLRLQNETMEEDRRIDRILPSALGKIVYNFDFDEIQRISV